MMEFMGGHHGENHCCMFHMHSTCGKICHGKMKPKLFGGNIKHCVEIKRHSTSTSKPHLHCEELCRGLGSWFGAALLPQHLDRVLDGKMTNNQKHSK